MSEKSSHSRKKWAVGSIIAVVAAGGGLVFLMQYCDAKREARDQAYQQEMEQWSSFQPSPLSGGVVETIIPGGHFIDLDTGDITSSTVGYAWDLQFNTDKGPSWVGLRADKSAEWADLGNVNIEKLKYRDVRDTDFISKREGENDMFLFLAHVTSAPDPGTTYAIKTSEDNIAEVQIVQYIRKDNGYYNLQVRYIVYPYAPDPPKPERK